MRRSLWSLVVTLSLALSLQAQLLMPKGAGKMVSQLITQPTTFYDGGGEHGKAPADISSALTLLPQYGEAIEITFSELDLGDALLYIYADREQLSSYYDDDDEAYYYTYPKATPLFVLRASELPTATIHATTAQGALTILYKGGRKPGAGWKAEVRSVAKRTGDQPVPLDPAGTIQMVRGARQVEIGESPLKFYDDGGATGKISEQFEGSVTFVPATTGHIIQLTFEQLDLFHTNPSRNDLLQVYSGRAADPAKLLKTLLKDPTPLTLLSADPEGCLTVSLKSTTGVPKDGFVATVSSIAPQPMRFVSATTTPAPEKEEAHAGTLGKPLLTLLVQADGTSSPLELEALTFDLPASSASLVSKLHLYAGTEATPSHLLGSLTPDPTGTRATLTLTPDKRPALIFGTNSYLITGDIAPSAQTGDALRLGVTSLTLSGTAHELSSPTPASFTLRNLYRSTAGTHTLTILHPWLFAPTMIAQHYEGGRTDQVTTFLPGQPGEKVEISFSAFDVLYQKSSYGTKAVFAVYSGQGRTGTPLWQLNEKTAGSIPPLLRSQSEDGALTIVFNPKETSYGRQGKGWSAEVRSLLPSPMRLVGTQVKQASTDMAPIGASDQELLDFSLTTAGALSPKVLERLQLHSTVAPETFRSLRLYQLPASKDYAHRTLLGEVTPSSQDFSLTLPTPLTLSEGESFYYLVADLAQDIPVGTALDIALTSLTLSGQEEAVPEGKPKGHRIAERIYLLRSGAQETFPVSEPLHFYDDGGATGRHSANCYGTVTFTPRTGEVIRLHPKQLKLHRLDTLYVYHGASIDPSQLAKKYTGAVIRDLEDIISTASEGALTVHFSGRYATDGWDIEVASIRPAPMRLQSLQLLPDTTSAHLLAGQQDVRLLHLALTIEGEYGTSELTSLDLGEVFPEGTAPWATFHLYSTELSNSFSTAQRFGSTTPEHPTTITGRLPFSKAGIYHLFLTADIHQPAQAGASLPTLALQPHHLSLGGQDEALPTLEHPLTLSLKQGVHGRFTIAKGTGADFSSLTEASRYLAQRGVDGPVELLLAAGRYEEDILLRHIPGLSSTNTLTIQPQGQRGEVIFDNKHYVQVDYSSDKLGYFTLDGISHVLFKGLAFQTDRVNVAPALVQLQHRSQHITFEDCSFTAPRSTELVHGSLALIRTHTGTNYPADNDFLTLRRCTFDGGHKATDILGLWDLTAPQQRGLTITGCTFRNQGSKAIYANDVLDLVLEGNFIEASGEVGANFQGIDATLTPGARITANRVHFGPFTGKVSSAQAFSLRGSRKTLSPAATKALVANNELLLRSDDNRITIYGIELNSLALPQLLIQHNSVRIYGAYTGTQSAPLAIYPREGGTLGRMTLQNNLLQNETKGCVISVRQGVKFAVQTFGNNLYYTDGATFAKYDGASLNPTLWRAQTSDLSSKVSKTEFVSPESSLLPKHFASLSFAKPVREVTQDLLGSERKPLTTAVGAYEVRPVVLPSLSKGYPQLVLEGGQITGLRVRLTDFGQLHYLLLPASQAAPSLEKLQEAPLSPVLSPVGEALLTLSPQPGQGEYNAYFLPVSTDQTKGAEVLSVPLVASSATLLPADFEQTALGEQTFTAGSWRFEGVEVIQPEAPYSSVSQRALKLSPSATIRLSYQQQPLPHEGFYLLSSSEVALTAQGAEGASTTKRLPATAGKWRYVSLRELGAFSALTLTSSGEVYLDDFGSQPQPLRLSSPAQEAQAGTSVTLTSTVEGGVWPYSYLWTNLRGDSLSTEPSYSLTPTHTTPYRLQVRDSWGQELLAQPLLTVRGQAVIADFEELGLSPESNWHGLPPTDPEEPLVTTTFYAGSYAFTNSHWEAAKTWGGFAYSNQTKTSYTTLFPDQFNSCVGTGALGSKTYAIAYTLGSETRLSPTHAEEAVIPGMYITNSAWVAQVAQQGTGIDGDSEAFKQGDYLLLHITSDQQKRLEIPLIDYRSSDPREHYVVRSWQWIDLTSLGAVRHLTFSLTGSRANQQGLTIPAYFCLDEVGSPAPATPASTLALAPQQRLSLPLEQLFADAGLPTEPTRPAHYELLTPTTGENYSAQLSEGTLELQAQGEGEGTLLLLRRQGQTRQYLRLPLSISQTTPVDEASLAERIQLYPNPASHEIRLQVDGQVAIYSLSGLCLYQQTNYHRGEPISIAHLPAGIYLVRTAHGSVRLHKR